MFILKNLNIEAKRTGSIVLSYLKETKKSELSLFLKTKGKKRKGSIVNYRSFAIPNPDYGWLKNHYNGNPDDGVSSVIEMEEKQ